MRKGIKILEETEGMGAEAVRGKPVMVNMRLFLPDGSELAQLNRYGQRMRINLARRDVIAGIRYGIEGMRVGGRRLFRIRPHLAYGAKGVPGQVPPDTEIHCEVELLEVREDNVMRPEDYPPGRKIHVFYSGELARSMARWQFGLEEDGRCGIYATVPIPGLKWRHARPKHLESKMDQACAAAIFDYVMEFPSRCAEECVQKPSGEGGDSGCWIDEHKETLRVNISVWERGKHIQQYSIAENSLVWLTSELYKTIEQLLVIVLSGAGKSPE